MLQWWIIAFAMKKAIVLIDPVTEWNPVVQAARNNCLVTITIQLSPIEDRMKQFFPSTTVLRSSGVSHVLNLQDRDVYNCVHKLKLLEVQENVKVQAVIPLAETAVDYSDSIAAMLGLTHHNPLHLTTSRRDKGFMKDTVRRAGIRVAKFERLKCASQVEEAMRNLQIELPVVIKTPQGFSTADVFICQTLSEAIEATDKVINGVGPEGRSVSHVLIEEYIGGTEFAVNIMAFDGQLTVTDVWKYIKTAKAGYSQADNCDPNDSCLRVVVEYCMQVANAVGVKFGAGHIEVKAQFNEDRGMYEDPCMMEIGARLSGGRKATMTVAALGGTWDPFMALIDTHSGIAPTYPDNFTPRKFVRHLFLPIERAGRIRKIQLDVSKLSSLHSHVILVREGDVVIETTDITTCAGFLWLVGTKQTVDRDSESALSLFRIEYG